MNRAPVVIAVGVNCAAGMDANASFNSAKNGTDALRKLSLFESQRYGEKFVAQANLSVQKNLSRCAIMLSNVIDEAFSKIDISSIESEKISLYFGTSIGGIFETENMLKTGRKSGNYNLSALSSYECSTLADFAAKKIKARGECATYSTACSSSSLAISDACNAISQGLCDIAVACGADALSRITVNGFGSLQLLSDEKCKPFDKNRDGINLGEAAAVLVISTEDVAKKIGAEILAYVSGWACSCDAYHATAPIPDGSGACRAFLEAARKAKMSPTDISYYNAHGTATLGNDPAEASAIKKFFGENIPMFSSVKRIFGHTLGASGLLNAAISIYALNSGVAPKNSGFVDVDENISISPIENSEPFKQGAIMSASLGFGGNNSVAIFSKRQYATLQILSRKKLFVYGTSILGNGSIYPEANMLKDISPLKKRKWAKLQKMGIETSRTAITNAQIATDVNRVSVCWGTGLGMVSQTAAFVENIFEKNEAEPMPTAFTNSVHNAVSSAIAINGKFGGLNSAVTAKEISFECALAQAIREINSGACDVSVVGASDEFIKYAANFLDSQHARYSKVGGTRLSDFAAACVIGVEHSCKSLPLAEILCVDIYRRNFDVREEAIRIESLLESLSISKDSLVGLFALSPVNKFQRNYLSELSKILGKDFEEPFGKYGLNYSISAAIVSECISRKNGFYLQYSLSSSSMSAITIFKVL